MNTFQARETLLTFLTPSKGLGLHLRLVALLDIPTTKIGGLYLCQYAAKIRLPLEQLELLVAAGARPDACTDPSNSPVAMYAKQGDLGQVCFFLLQSIPEEQAKAALLEACETGAHLIVRALLGYCDLNERYPSDAHPEEYTCPLEVAVERDDIRLVRMLLREGASDQVLPRGRLLRAASSSEVLELLQAQFPCDYDDTEDEEDETFSYSSQPTSDAEGEDLEWGSGDEEVRLSWQSMDLD